MYYAGRTDLMTVTNACVIMYTAQAVNINRIMVKYSLFNTALGVCSILNDEKKEFITLVYNSNSNKYVVFYKEKQNGQH